MLELIFFAALMLPFAVGDIRRMARDGRGAEIAVYVVLCAGTLAGAALYFPTMYRRNILSVFLNLLRIRV
ncbi:MAG: hypothetical protein LBN99_04230 [Oscillospiraceae bacterium]|jgi:hypothetical protein|nr:hypothetical protein [Oscillospiraceae bacterium]